MSKSRVSRAFLVLLVGTACSCLIGLAAYGIDIFKPHMPAFQFLTSGIVSSAIAAAVLVGRRGAVWAVAVVALVVFLAVMRPTTGAGLVRDLAYIPTLLASVSLSWSLAQRLTFAGPGRVFAWGVVFAACHLAMFGILTAANGTDFDPQVAYAVSRIGGLVGLGVGAGVYLAGQKGSALAR